MTGAGAALAEASRVCRERTRSIFFAWVTGSRWAGLQQLRLRRCGRVQGRRGWNHSSTSRPHEGLPVCSFELGEAVAKAVEASLPRPAAVGYSFNALPESVGYGWLVQTG